MTGLFDAVLLLAAPALLVAATAGALLPRRTGGRELPGAGRPTRFGAAGMALVLVLLTATWTAAVVRTAADRNRSTLEAAARLAPGEHRLHLILAERGNCAHARRAAELLPHNEVARRMASGCGG